MRKEPQEEQSKKKGTKKEKKKGSGANVHILPSLISVRISALSCLSWEPQKNEVNELVTFEMQRVPISLSLTALGMDKSTWPTSRLNISFFKKRIFDLCILGGGEKGVNN